MIAAAAGASPRVKRACDSSCQRLAPVRDPFSGAARGLVRIWRWFGGCLFDGIGRLWCSAACARCARCHPAAGLRATNARLRELLTERDAEDAGLRALVAGLQAQVAALGARVQQNSRNSSKPSPRAGLAERADAEIAASQERAEALVAGRKLMAAKIRDYYERL